MIRSLLISMLLATFSLTPLCLADGDEKPWLSKTITSESGDATGTLWMPMKSFVKSIPLGFSFCSNTIDQQTRVKFQPDLTQKFVEIEGNCVHVSYALIQRRTLFTIKTGNDSVFRVPLHPKPGVVYKDRRFRIVHTDDQFFLTISFDTKLPKDSSFAILCNHRDKELLAASTRPYRSSDRQFKQLKITSIPQSFCYKIEKFPWDSGYWETYFQFSKGKRIKFIEKVN